MADQRKPASGTSRSVRTRAVVLCAPNARPAMTLLEALSRRGVEPMVVDDAFSATLVIAKSTEVDAHPPALIVVEPQKHRDGLLEDVLRTVSRRFSGVAVWRFDESARPPLRAFSGQAFSDVRGDHPQDSNGSSPVVVRKTGRSSAPALRLTDHARPPETPPGKPPEMPRGAPPASDASARAANDSDDATPSALLSEEELAMLLSDDFDHPTR